jgi:hypothetical protein
MGKMGSETGALLDRAGPRIRISHASKFRGHDTLQSSLALRPGQQTTYRSTMLVLYETAMGFALFKLTDSAKITDPDLYKEFETPERANGLCV